jgi:four helix bundle protein
MDASSSKPIQSYRDLLVWQKGMDLVTLIYPLTKKLPSAELYGLTSQMRRAAISIPANISEGHIRRHTGDFIHHLSISLGSVAEMETHLEACVRLSLLTARDV